MNAETAENEKKVEDTKTNPDIQIIKPKNLSHTNYIKLQIISF